MKRVLIIISIFMCLAACDKKTHDYDFCVQFQLEKDSIIEVIDGELLIAQQQTSTYRDSTNFYKARAKRYLTAGDSIRSLLIIANTRCIQLRDYGMIVANNPSQVVFLKGWINRAMSN